MELCSFIETAITVPNILNLFPWIVPADIIHRITRLWNICVHLWLLSDGLYHFNKRALRFRTTARSWRIKNWGTTSMSLRRHFILFCLFSSELYPARLSSYLPSTHLSIKYSFSLFNSCHFCCIPVIMTIARKAKHNFVYFYLLVAYAHINSMTKQNLIT